jgi:hypothetical protein
MTRVLSRKDLSRTLLMYGAFAASAVILGGDDARSLVVLRRLRVKLQDERGPVVERVIRGLERIMAQEAMPPGIDGNSEP